jgi:hypothetical protein
MPAWERGRASAPARRFIKDFACARVMPMHRVWGPVSIVLILLGIAFFAVFGLANGHPADVGVYSGTIMLLGAGLGGLWASMNMGEQAES